MPTKFYIESRGIPEAQNALREIPGKLAAAAKRANRKAATYAKGRMAKAMAAETGIPLRAFRQHRAKSTASKMWFGANDIQAIYAAPQSRGGAPKPKANAFGVWAGKYWFEGAFVATMPSGHVGIFKRAPGVPRGSPGELVEQRIPLPMAPRVAEEVAAQATDRLSVLLAQELRYEKLKA